MEEQIIEVLKESAPLIAGFFTSIVIPWAIKRRAVKKLEKKIDEVNEGTQLVEINKQLKDIRREIMEMRGKTK